MAQQLDLFTVTSVNRRTIRAELAALDPASIYNPGQIDPRLLWVKQHAGQAVEVIEQPGLTYKVKACDGSVQTVFARELEDPTDQGEPIDRDGEARGGM